MANSTSSWDEWTRFVQCHWTALFAGLVFALNVLGHLRFGFPESMQWLEQFRADEPVRHIPSFVAIWVAASAYIAAYALMHLRIRAAAAAWRRRFNRCAVMLLYTLAGLYMYLAIATPQLAANYPLASLAFTLLVLQVSCILALYWPMSWVHHVER